MNAEPPTARFRVEHQPRRPGYRQRYAIEESPMWNRVKSSLKATLNPTPISWRGAFTICALAAYLPFVGMALYALAYVPSGDAGIAALALPAGAGAPLLYLLLAAFQRHGLLPDSMVFVLGGVLSAAIVFGCASLGRIRGWCVVAGSALVFVGSCLLAGLMVALIRA